jgi:homospermidine synthase
MSKHEVHVNFGGRIVFVGFGSIGQGVLPLILRHIGTSADRITIVTAEDAGLAEAQHFGVEFVKCALTRENYRRTLEPLLKAGDFLLNLSVDVSSLALIELARERGALYLDTCIEPWAGGYVDKHATVAARSNYAMRLKARIGVAFGEAGAAQHRPGHEGQRGIAVLARRLGEACPDARHQGDPRRGAGLPGRERAEGAG